METFPLYIIMCVKQTRADAARLAQRQHGYKRHRCRLSVVNYELWIAISIGSGPKDPKGERARATGLCFCNWQLGKCRCVPMKTTVDLLADASQNFIDPSACLREREGGRERETERETETERHREKERERETERQIERQREVYFKQHNIFSCFVEKGKVMWLAIQMNALSEEKRWIKEKLTVL